MGWIEHKIDSVSSKHVIPGGDPLKITFGNGFGGARLVRIAVKNQSGEVVYNHKIEKSDKTHDWDGRLTQATDSSPLAYVTPDGSPYTVHLEAYKTEGGRAAKLGRRGARDVASLAVGGGPAPRRAVEAKFHSLKLELLPWADAYKFITGKADTNDPGGAGKDRIAWAQYKLNELGFFAGPITGKVTPDLNKAVRRYRQAHKQLYRRPWKPADDFEFVVWNDRKLEGLFAIDDELCGKLAANENKRDVLAPDGDPGAAPPPDPANVINDKSKLDKARLYVDGGRHYIAMDELFPAERRIDPTTSKRTHEEDWLTRPILPLKATVLFEDENGHPVRALLSGAQLRWSWKDEAEVTAQDATTLPKSVPDAPSQTALYVDQAHKRLRSIVDSEYRGARQLVGGILSGKEKDDQRAGFEPFAEFPFDPATIHRRGYAQTDQWSDRNKKAEFVGCSCVWFRPSLLAGDNYTLKVELTGASEAGRSAEAAVSAMVGARGKVETGKITVWRRERIAAHVSWPKMQGAEWDQAWNRLHGTPAIDWDALWKDVRAEYKHAFIALDGPDGRVGTPTDFAPDFANKFREVVERVAAAHPTSDFWSGLQADQKTYNANALYPIEPRGQRYTQTDANAVQRRVTGLLQPEIDAWQHGTPADADFRGCKRFLAVRDLLEGWEARDKVVEGVVGDAKLSELVGDLILKEARTHYLAEIKKLVSESKAVDCDRYTAVAYKDPATVAARDLEPYQLPSGIAAGMVTRKSALKTAPLVRQKVHDRIVTLLGGEYTTWQGGAAPASSDRLTAVVNLLQVWKQGHDVVVADAGIVGDQKSSEQADDQVLVRAGAHYEQQLQSFADFGALAPDKTRVGGMRYKTPTPAITPYAVSPRLTSEIAERAKQSKIDELNLFAKKTQVPLLEQLEEAVFRAHGAGIILLDFCPHPPIAQPPPTPSKIDKVFAMANGHGLVILDQAHLREYKWYHLFAHEIAHCLFLRHWKNAPGFSQVDHDHADDNCQMSYAVEPGNTAGRITSDQPHYAVGQYKPHFCGKCNLKLRGWNIRAKTGGRDAQGRREDALPASSGAVLDPILLPWVPNVPFQEWADPNWPKLPSPDRLKVEAETLLSQLLPGCTPSTLWLNGRPVDKANAVAAIGNPKPDDDSPMAKVRWPSLKFTILPEGTLRDASTQTCAYPYYGNPNWQESLEDWGSLGGRTTSEGIQMLTHYIYGEFTDLVHETCHFFQSWNSGRAMNECITDLFGFILSKRIYDSMGGHAEQARFKYAFNPSYMESVLCGIDQWLPRMGLEGLADLYVRGTAARLTNILQGDVAGQLEDHLNKSTAIQARRLYNDSAAERDVDGKKYYKGDSDDAAILRNPNTAVGALRPDIQKAIDNADAALQNDLKAAIHAFIDALEGQLDHFTAPKKRAVSGLTGVKRAYELARLARRTRKQIAYTNELRLARQFKEIATDQERSVEKLDEFIAFKEKELKDLNVSPQEPSDEIEDQTGRTRSTYY